MLNTDLGCRERMRDLRQHPGEFVHAEIIDKHRIAGPVSRPQLLLDALYQVSE
jgi:hypothetical protein